MWENSTSFHDSDKVHLSKKKPQLPSIRRNKIRKPGVELNTPKLEHKTLEPAIHSAK